MSILDWINTYRDTLETKINPVLLGDIEDWHYENGEIKRKDSAFFSIVGIQSDDCTFAENELPLINQPEIGILGFLVSRGENGLRILLHAKSEPGNVGITQIGPSVQSTISNYKKRHGGKGQNYIDFFLDEGRPKLVSMKQSEQGTRFLNKYNLNVVVEVHQDEIDTGNDKYRWFDIKEVIEVLNTDFLFNTDFKSVISHLLEDQIIEHGPANTNPLLNSYFNNKQDNGSDVIQKLVKKREKLQFSIKQVPLDELDNWSMNEEGIHPQKANSFGYGYFGIQMHDREVLQWGQPLVTKESDESLVLLTAIINNEYHFIFRERSELGFKNFMQLGPTYQVDDESGLEFEVTDKNTLIEFQQSEEGGRFFQNISKYRICLAGQADYYQQSDQYHILNAFQICSLLKTKGVFSNEARSIISSLVPLVSQ